jgi:hypothetical protein
LSGRCRVSFRIMGVGDVHGTERSCGRIRPLVTLSVVGGGIDGIELGGRGLRGWWLVGVSGAWYVAGLELVAGSGGFR